jgi:hypothetical protein
MRARTLCPFCTSHLIVVTGATELLTDRQCSKCSKRWAEANVPFSAANDVRASAGNAGDLDSIGQSSYRSR